MHAKKPIIVLVAVYNDQPGLDKTLQSLVASFGMVDVLVIDDASLLPAHTNLFPDAPVHIIRHAKNKGVELVKNTGLEYGCAEGYRYIAILDAGDKALPGRFEKQYAFLEEHPDYGAVGSGIDCVTPDGQFVRNIRYKCTPEEINRHFKMGNPMSHPTMMMRTDVVKKVGFYSDQFRCSEDYDYFWRLSKIAKLGNLDEPLVAYEINPNSVTNRNRRKMVHAGVMIKLHYFDYLDPLSYYGVLRFLFLSALWTRYGAMFLKLVKPVTLRLRQCRTARAMAKEPS